VQARSTRATVKPSSNVAPRHTDDRGGRARSQVKEQLMMRPRFRGGLAALVAVFALALVASASASAALPEFGLGAKESFPVSFTVSGGASTWYPGGSSWQCSGLSGSGTISGAKTVTGTTLKFTLCGFERSGSKVWCKTEGAEKGEIRTNALAGTLVYRSKAAKTVGIDFTAQSGKSLGSFTCLGSTGEIRGSVVLPIALVNTRASEFTLSSTNGAKEYENEAGEKLTAKLESDWPSTFEPLGWAFESRLVTSKSLEIKA
jgi:hypothetical protein